MMYMAKSLAELNSYIDVDSIIRGRSVKCVINSASTLFNKAKEFNDQKNYENAYIYFMKFYQCLKYIQASEEYKRDKRFYNILMGNQQVEAIEKAEELSHVLDELYNSLEKKKNDEIVHHVDKKLKSHKFNDVNSNETAIKINLNASKNESLTRGAQSKDKCELKFVKKLENESINHNSNKDMNNLPPHKREFSILKYISLEAFYKLLLSSVKGSFPPQKHNLNEKYLLIVDIRSINEYVKAHIDYPFIINVPKDIMTKNLSSKIVLEWFEQSSFLDKDVPLQSFKCHRLFDYIILVDWNGEKGHPDCDSQEIVVHNLFQESMSKVYVLEGGFANFEAHYPSQVITDRDHMAKRTVAPKSSPIFDRYHVPIGDVASRSKVPKSSPEIQFVNGGGRMERTPQAKNDPDDWHSSKDGPIKYPDLSVVVGESRTINLGIHGRDRAEAGGSLLQDLPIPSKSFLYPEENLRQTVSRYEVIPRRKPEPPSQPRAVDEWPSEPAAPAPSYSLTNVPQDPTSNKHQTAVAKNYRAHNTNYNSGASFDDRDIRNPAFLTKYGITTTTLEPAKPEATFSTTHDNLHKLPYPLRDGALKRFPDPNYHRENQNTRRTEQPKAVSYQAYNFLNPSIHTPLNPFSYPQRPVADQPRSYYRAHDQQPTIVGTLHRVRSNPDLPKIHALVSESLAATDDDFANGLRRLNLAKPWAPVNSNEAPRNDFSRDGNPLNARAGPRAPNFGPPVSNHRYGQVEPGVHVPNVDRTLKPSTDSGTISCSSSASTLRSLDDTPTTGLSYDYSDALNSRTRFRSTSRDDSTLSNSSQPGNELVSTSAGYDGATSPSSTLTPLPCCEEIFTRDRAPILAAGPSPISTRSSPRFRPDGQGSYGLTGILNTGNSCFMNSTLQSLSHTVPLAEYFVNRRFLDHLNRRRKGFAPNRSLAAEFSNVCGGLWSGKHQSINPISFTESVTKYIPGIEMGVQQDCHEFLTFLLDGLHEDLNRAPSNSSSNTTSSSVSSGEGSSSSQTHLADYELAFKAEEDYTRHNDSIIVDLMNGQLKSVVICLRCAQKSITFDTFQGLSLPLPSSGKCTLQDCLRLFLSPEPIHDWKCPKCNKRTQASKELFLWKIPPILIIHLMRFKTEGHFHKKITTAVDFPLNGFDLTNYCAEVRQNERLPEYTLYAISNHYGTLEGGHYTAFCKSPINQRWYKYDDQQVMEISSNDVRTPAAYLLFYTSLGMKTPDFL